MFALFALALLCVIGYVVNLCGRLADSLYCTKTADDETPKHHFDVY